MKYTAHVLALAFIIFIVFPPRAAAQGRETLHRYALIAGSNELGWRRTWVSGLHKFDKAVPDGDNTISAAPTWRLENAAFHSKQLREKTGNRVHIFGICE